MKLVTPILASLAPAAALAQRAPTFVDDIAPIVHDHCAECHRPGEAAPFPLLTYRDVQKRGEMLVAVTESGYMPPWHPVDGHGEFAGQRGLTEAERTRLADWVAGGSPEGDPARTPAPPEFSSSWRLGEPDLVVEMDRAFEVPARGPDIYRNFVLPLGLEEDRWVTAIDVRPSARSVVHHVLFFYDTTGSARELEAEDGMPGFHGMGFRRSGSLGGWAVGASAYALPGGLAMELPAGADLVLQTHFHPSGKAEAETTTVGIYFSDEPPSRNIVGLMLPPQYAAFAGLDVPAGEPAFTLRDSLVLPVATDLVTVGAHAHYIGSEMRAWATLPDGTERKLFYIDDWDFNWQGRYVYREPVRLPAGTTLEAEIVYDNSAANPRNPFSPPQRITWGLESTDEMGAISFVAVAAEEPRRDELQEAVRAKNRAARQARRRISVDWYTRVMRLDVNGDGRISKDEVPEVYRRGLERLDENGDGDIDEDELAELQRFSERQRGRTDQDG